MKSVTHLGLEDFKDVAIWTSRNGIFEPASELEEIPDGARDLWVAVHGKLADETEVRGFARVECPPPAFYDHKLRVDEQEIDLRFEGSRLLEPEGIAEKLQRPLTHVFPIWIRAEVKAECTGDNIAQEIDVTGPANASV